MARIVCPDCGESVAPENVELSTRLAKCTCGNVFDLSSQVAGQTGQSAGARRRDLAVPAGWTVEGGGPRDAPGGEGAYRRVAHGASEPLTLSRRWFRPHAIFLAFFCVAWDSFLVFWYGVALGAGGPSGSGQLMMLVFPIAHVAAGIGLSYYTLALFLNRTLIRLEGGEARVTHGPLYWRGNQSVSLSGLRGVFVRRERSGTRKRQPTWTVLLDTDGNAALPLVGGLPSEEDARFVAAHIADREQVSGP